jgi:hypothetical protein
MSSEDIPLIFNYASGDEEPRTSSPGLDDDQFFEGLSEQRQQQMATSVPSPELFGNQIVFSQNKSISTSAPSPAVNFATSAPTNISKIPPLKSSLGVMGSSATDLVNASKAEITSPNMNFPARLSESVTL